MPASVHSQQRDQDSATTIWVVVFILLSLLAHALLFLTIFVVSIFTPKIELPAPPPKLTFTLEAAPKPPPLPRLIPAPPPPREFVRTDPQQDVPHKETQLISENDSRLASQNNITRNPNSLMPNIESPHKHPGDLTNSPNVPTHQKTDPAQSQSSPAPQHPPTNPVVQNTENKPPKPPTPPEPVDPNALPVLPPISAPTLAQEMPPGARPTTQAEVYPQIDSEIEGLGGVSGKPSPEAMQTDLGQYKYKVWAAVASRWYPKVNDAIQRLSVGVVRIQFTISSDGTMHIDKVLEGENEDQLLPISQDSLTDSAPFEPFTDGMIKELHGASSYTDEFSFSVYGR